MPLLPTRKTERKPAKGLSSLPLSPCPLACPILPFFLGTSWVSWRSSEGRHCACVLTQSCPALCDPVDCSPPGSSVHGILQARTLERTDITFFQTQGSSPCVLHLLHWRVDSLPLRSLKRDTSLSLNPKAGSSPTPSSLEPHPSLLDGERPLKDINFMTCSLPEKGGYIRKGSTQFPGWSFNLGEGHGVQGRWC